VERRLNLAVDLKLLSLPKSFFFCAGGAAEISRRWNRRNAGLYFFAPRQGRRIRARRKEVSQFEVPSRAPAGARQVGVRLPAVPPPANIHRPFRAKSKNRLSQKIWVKTGFKPLVFTLITLEFFDAILGEEAK
jgi:hypothetical protein